MQHTGTGRPTSRRNRLRVWLVVVLALGLLATACSDADDAEGTTSPATTESASDRSGGAEAESPTADSSRSYATEDDGESRSRDIAEPESESSLAEEPAEDRTYAEARDEGSADYVTAASAAADAAQAAASAEAATGGVSRAEAAASEDAGREQPRRVCVECQANTFEDYGVNPFVDTYEDALSTFALDVDTASYVVTRNYLEGGQLPPIEAVRVEEFVNYFDGGYTPVIDDFNISLDAAPSPFSDPDRVMLRVGRAGT